MAEVKRKSWRTDLELIWRAASWRAVKTEEKCIKKKCIKEVFMSVGMFW